MRFWTTVELFNPPGVKRPDPQERRYRYEPGRPLPWEPGHRIADAEPPDRCQWRHTVYLGVYRLDAAREIIEDRFGRDAESFDARPPGDSALAAMVVTQSGRPLLASAILSSCAWGTGHLTPASLRSPGRLSELPGELAEAQAQLQDCLKELIGPEPDDDEAVALRRAGHEVGRRLDGATLTACVEAAAAVAGAGGLQAREIRIETVPVGAARALDADGTDFLNSYLLEDLSRVAGHVGAGNVGAALATYLQPEDDPSRAPRIDVQTDLAAVVARTAPEHVALGHWPDAPDRPLALGQQLAVCSLLRMSPTQGGLFGVNGPPGTGKTTMLRDVIAALVVERATRLAELANPKAAFVGTSRWKTGDYTRTVHHLDPKLTGFEVVLASANNTAVENVSHEIPGRHAVDEMWLQATNRLDYFSEIASGLLAGEDATHESSENADAAAWALIAARLGRRAHRVKFVQRFWWGDKPRAKQTPAAHEGSDATSERDQTIEGLDSILQRLERTRLPASSWTEAVATFRRALQTATSLQEERQAAYEQIVRVHELEAALHDATQASGGAEQLARKARAARPRFQAALTAAEAERGRRVERRTAHRAFRPGLIESVSSLGRATRDWRAHDGELGEAVANAEHAEDGHRAELTDATFRIEAATIWAASRRAVVDHHAKALAEVRTRLEEARRVLGDRLPDASWFEERNRARRETAPPWTDELWNRSRSALFIAALELHQAFIRQVPRELRQTLRGAVDVVTGDAPADLAQDTALGAWQALFLVVPVVSTTFASFGSMFSHLGRESLGWVLIDEGGQATPQSAVGALWRAKRGVVVGDPRQLEPIAPLPFRAEQALRQIHGVDEQWSPSGTSVQRLADRQTDLGTSQPDGERRIWVGAPLTVHRRCDQPMFGLVNEIAYGGAMIHATGDEAARAFTERHPTLPDSKWIDVVSTEAQGHWVPAEGEQVTRILAALWAVGVSPSEVMVIAPFRNGADQLRHHCNTSPGLRAGTIHTGQGREAEIVILVLGSDPRNAGARRWAAAKPNLLNVAASRAKRRLYVIGDRAAWSELPYFETLAALLPPSRPRPAP